MAGADEAVIVALPPDQSSCCGYLRERMYQEVVERWNWVVVRAICVGFYPAKDLR